jgi:cytochrome oxidase Cu insertion factor (SCO1/SenC/PrrC family)/thiol-disulfide isomerase/thioredoxin
MSLVTARRMLVAFMALLTCALLPAHALADGDPGSDVLLLQNLYVDDTFPAPPQLQLGALLNATIEVGQPVRVAIIRQSDDLGTVTKLWREPQTYADYLGIELSDTYSGRLLIVMPNGFGVYWSADKSGADSLAHALSSLSVGGDSPAALVAATKAALYRIEAVDGIGATTLNRHLSAAAPAGGGGAGLPATTPAATTPATVGHSATRVTTKSAHSHADVLVIVVVVLLLAAYVAFLRGWRPKIRLRRLLSADGLKGVRVKPVALLPAGLLLIVVLALVVNQGNSTDPASVSGGTLATNPNLDQGTPLYTKSDGLAVAPQFKLTDETGQPVSLRQYRGKVVILGFVDAECETICPLTTAAMLDAKRSLGPAGKDVQLVGVDVNWKSTQILDVLNYTTLHGLAGQWHFLTGSLPQLQRVWTAYKVNEKSLIDEDSNAIDHVPAIYVIDPQGRIRTTYTTDDSYAAIPQLGQLLAKDASRLLPSHPKVSSHYSYAEVKGITPAQTYKLPRSGGGTVTLGPGKAHLYLFFATWDQQTTPIASELSELNAYQRAARADGLPPLTAVDEGSVEPSPQALPDFLKTVPQPLQYPVAIDNSGRVADGYEVEGEPWFVLTSPTGGLDWVQEVYYAGWPSSLTALEKQVKAALSKAPAVPTSEVAAQRELVGSPAPLAALHAQASRLLPGGALKFYERLTRLLGYPVVVNVWASWCTPCQAEFHLFSNASALYGKQVAFVGADTDSQTLTGDARAFLRSHQVSYPSYQVPTTLLNRMLVGGLEGTPTTVYLSPGGKVIYVHPGQYLTQGSLDLDVEDYALGGAN